MTEARRRRKIQLFLCGDVMTGRGIDQILPFSSSPEIYEGWATDAREYVELAEQSRRAHPGARDVRVRVGASARRDPGYAPPISGS